SFFNSSIVSKKTSSYVNSDSILSISFKNFSFFRFESSSKLFKLTETLCFRLSNCLSKVNNEDSIFLILLSKMATVFECVDERFSMRFLVSLRDRFVDSICLLWLIISCLTTSSNCFTMSFLLNLIILMDNLYVNGSTIWGCYLFHIKLSAFRNHITIIVI